MNQSNNFTKGNIIVVDDNTDNLNLLVSTLTQEGYTVRAAVSGKLALSSAQTITPDLILLDILMPEIDGYEVCRQLKLDDRTRDIPVIFISALDEGIDKAKGFEVGGIDYISKPFQQLEVIARVENQLRLCMAKKQLQEQNLQLQQFSSNLKALHRLDTTNYADFDELCTDYLQTGCKILGFTMGSINKITGNIRKIEAFESEQKFSLPRKEFDLNSTLCADVAKKGETVTYSQPIDKNSLEKNQAKQNFDLQSYLGTPIWVNDQIYGTLSFFSIEVRKKHFTIHEREFIELMAQSLGKYIMARDTENKRKKAEEETQLLLNITQAINEAVDFETALQAALAQVCEATGWSYGEVWIPNNNQTFLECSPAWYYNNRTQEDPAVVASIEKFRQLSQKFTFAANQGLVGRVWQQGEARYLENIKREVEFNFVRKKIADECGIEVGLAVPIVTHSNANLAVEKDSKNKVLAVLVFFLVEDSYSDFYPKKERLVELVSAVATQLGTVMQHKKTEAKLQSLFMAIDDLIVVYDRSGTCLKTMANKPELLVKSAEEKNNFTVGEDLPTEVAALHLAAIQRTIETKVTQTIEYSLQIEDRLKWFSGKFSPLSASKVILVAREISDRKLMEQKLRTNEAEMRGIFESMTDFVLTLNIETENVQVMPTNYQRLYQSEVDLLSETIQQFYTESEELSFWTPARQAIARQQTISFEYSLNINGEPVWFNASISPLLGNLVIWVARDISDRVKAELELQQLANELDQRVQRRTAQLQEANQILLQEINDRILAQTELAKSEARFRLAIENIPDMFAIYDKQLRFEFINAVGLEIIGKPVSELIGRKDTEVFPAKRTSTYLFLLHQAVATRQLQRGEITLNLPSLGERTMIVAYVPLLDENKEIYQILCITHDISDRKRSEQALQVAKEQLQAMIDAVPGFVSWLKINRESEQNTDELTYLGVNQHLAESFNLSPDKFLDQKLGFLQQGVQFTEFIRNFFLSPDASNSRIIEIEIDKLLHHYLIVAQKYQQDTAAVTIGIDISDRIEAESKLQKAYQRLQLFSELTLKIRQSLDLEEILQTTVTEVQKLLAADRVLIVAIAGEPPGSIIKEAVLPGFPSLQAEKLDPPSPNGSHFQQFFQGKCIVVNDVQQLNLSPDQLKCLERLKIRAKLIVPIFIQNSIWGGLIIQQGNSRREWQAEEIEILQQLADQISIAVAQAQLLENLEEKVVERTAELHHSEKQLRLITDALPVRICYVDAQERYRFNNKAYEKWFGLPIEQITGRKNREILGESYYQQIKQYIVTALSGERVTFELQEPEINGKNRYVSITYIPDINQEGQTIGFFGVAIDLSDRKAIEQMKDDFISVASHELRTPLTSIRGSLGLLSTGRLGELSDRGQRMLEIAVNNTDRLHRLINDILDLARIESGRVQMVKENCNAVDLITQAKEAMQSMANQENVTLQLETEQSQIEVWADPDQILQTLTNLISNAIKFSYQGGTVAIAVQVAIAATNQDREVLFQIIDTGRGIPADKLELIFDRFQQVDASDSREKGGTGLGLPICREIVQQHGGKIWVESELGAGSTFYFTLRGGSSQAITRGRK